MWHSPKNPPLPPSEKGLKGKYYNFKMMENLFILIIQYPFTHKLVDK